MAGNFSLPTVLANLTAGNQALSLVDGDFDALYNPLVSLNTFSNYYADTGAANAYVITVSSPQTVSQAVGLRVQFLAANANTGASTLQINALAAKNILNLDGTALGAGQIAASALVDVMYDGTQYLLLNQAAPVSGTTASTFTFNGSGGTTGSLTMAWTRVGKVVTLYIPTCTGTSGTGSTTLTSNTALPSAIRPTTNQQQVCTTSFNNGGTNSAPGVVKVDTSGIVTFLQTGSALAYTNSTTCGTGAALTYVYTLGI